MNEIFQKIINSGDISWEELFYISLGEDLGLEKVQSAYDDGYRTALVEAAPVVDEALKQAYKMSSATEFENLPYTATTVDLSKTKKSKHLTENELMEAIKNKSGSLNLVLGTITKIEGSDLDEESPKKLLKYLQSAETEEYENIPMSPLSPGEQRILEQLKKPTARKLTFSDHKQKNKDPQPKKKFKATIKRPDSPYEGFVPFELEYDKHSELIKALKRVEDNVNYRYVKDLTVAKIKNVPNMRDKTIRVELHKAYYPNKKKGEGKSKRLRVEPLEKFANLKIVKL